MKINSTNFGSITVTLETFDHEIFIRLNVQVEKREKRFSKKRTELPIKYYSRKQGEYIMKGY